LKKNTTKIENITIGKRLGEGNFGDVYKGIWNGTTAVALKKLKLQENNESFLTESSTLKKLHHPNIVQFLGIYTEKNGTLYIVTEFLSLGSLDLLLRENRNIEFNSLLDMCIQIVSGMIYLENQKIVHRDLALRNILVTTKDSNSYLIKIGDLGLSRILYSNYYKSNTSIMPIRWVPLESIQYGKFSHKSDVWGLGVVFWEIFTFGMIPYAGLGNLDIISYLSQGNRLVPPDICPVILKKLMLQCWSENPIERPSFMEIYNTIISLFPKPQQENLIEMEHQYSLTIHPDN